MEFLRVENIKKIYRLYGEEVCALGGVSFSVQKGEFIAIVGASGSGKSTLLHIIGGVDRPTEGRVYVNGTDIYAGTERELTLYRRRQVGIIYQFFNLIPVLNAKENIALPLELDGKKLDDRKLEAAFTTGHASGATLSHNCRREHEGGGSAGACDIS